MVPEWIRHVLVTHWDSGNEGKPYRWRDALKHSEEQSLLSVLRNNKSSHVNCFLPFPIFGESLPKTCIQGEQRGGGSWAESSWKYFWQERTIATPLKSLHPDSDYPSQLRQIKKKKKNSPFQNYPLIKIKKKMIVSTASNLLHPWSVCTFPCCLMLVCLNYFILLTNSKGHSQYIFLKSHTW